MYRLFRLLFLREKIKMKLSPHMKYRKGYLRGCENWNKLLLLLIKGSGLEGNL